MGTGHSVACLTSRKVKLVAVADPDVEKRDASIQRMCDKIEPRATRELASVGLFGDYQSMVESGTIDAMIVALPNTLHAPASIYGMKHGVHVLCEKPPTNTVSEMKRVARVAKDTGCTYAFGRQPRFDATKDAARGVGATPSSTGNSGASTCDAGSWSRSETERR